MDSGVWVVLDSGVLESAVVSGPEPKAFSNSFIWAVRSLVLRTWYWLADRGSSPWSSPGVTSMDVSGGRAWVEVEVEPEELREQRNTFRKDQNRATQM